MDWLKGNMQISICYCSEGFMDLMSLKRQAPMMNLLFKLMKMIIQSAILVKISMSSLKARKISTNTMNFIAGAKTQIITCGHQ